jgi:hypothetical protein
MPIAEINPMFFNLKKQHQERIQYLQKKIEEQEKEIKDLQTKIQLLSLEKDYDC